MFESITEKIAAVFKNLRGLGKITEKNIAEELHSLRLVLIDADVSVGVVETFIANVKAKSLGQKVLARIAPEQQIVKIIHDEIAALLGSEDGEDFMAKKPIKILLAGLHGAGKTTTAAKLAFFLKSRGYAPLLVGCDVQRPAAMEQLKILAEGNELGFFCEKDCKNVLKIAAHALDFAANGHNDALIFDTAGRLQVDDALIGEIKALKKLVSPDESLLVVDGAIGQEAANVAKVFNDALSLTGIILTKLDGDARGGAALSMKGVTGVPIRMVGTGERIADLEPFRPKRMAQRILGMGDIVSLVEKAQQQVDEKQRKSMSEKIKKAQFDLEDFLQSLQQIQKLGPMSSLMKMFPGAAPMGVAEHDNGQLKRAQAIIQSMTIQERRKPGIVDQHRRMRIARGAGVEMKEVNALLKQFSQMQKMMKSFKGEKGRKNMQALAAQFGILQKP
ncbi:MAG: signal recognition particle protein [Puniceicoccales bacterium]|jgi:signal recognition particle subunit SRP54|nr:signal recognition particle protein [Puniceicoccales bacterium]